MPNIIHRVRETTNGFYSAPRGYLRQVGGVPHESMLDRPAGRAGSEARSKLSRTLSPSSLPRHPRWRNPGLVNGFLAKSKTSPSSQRRRALDVSSVHDLERLLSQQLRRGIVEQLDWVDLHWPWNG